MMWKFIPPAHCTLPAPAAAQLHCRIHLQHSQRAEPGEGVHGDAPEPVVTQDAAEGRAESQLWPGFGDFTANSTTDRHGETHA